MGLSAREQAVCSEIISREKAMRDDLARLVAIPTGRGYTPGLDETREILTDRLAALGARIEHVPGLPRPDWVDPDSAPNTPIPPTAVCHRIVETSHPRILLAGHIDTVHDPQGPFRRLEIDPAGNAARGPGAADMKGGLLVAIHALEALENRGVRVSWGFVLNSDEETGSFHSDAVLRHAARDFDFGLIFEPALPDGALVLERPGSGQFRIETTGVPAHVGRDFTRGVSAILEMARCVQYVHELADPPRGLIASIGVIRGGQATNIVPDRCLAWGNVRFRTPEIAREIESRFAALARSESPPHIRVDLTLNRPAKPLTAAVRSLANLAQAIAHDLGQTLPFGTTGGVCDGNNLQAAGLPVIDTLGVRGGGLHTHDEWIDLASLGERAQLVALLLMRLSEGQLTA
jgi:glutamate carboxypeptidase